MKRIFIRNVLRKINSALGARPFCLAQIEREREDSQQGAVAEGSASATNKLLACLVVAVLLAVWWMALYLCRGNP